MSDIEDHQRRIVAALGRMQRAYEAAHDAAMAAAERAAAAEAERDALAGLDHDVADAGEEPQAAPVDPMAAELDVPPTVAGVDAADGAGPAAIAGDDGDELIRLRAELAGTAEALEAERAANAELTERLNALRRRESVVLTEARTEAEAMQARLSDFEDSCHRLRMANAQLRRNAAALRAAHAAGLPDAGLVNEALQAELDALQATRAADRAELDSILSALGPMIAEEETAHG